MNDVFINKKKKQDFGFDTIAALADIAHENSSFDQTYQVGRVIGYGGGATVKEVISRNMTNATYAAKIISKKNGGVYNFLNEIQIMKELDHPNIIKLISVYTNDPSDIYIVMEKGGTELFDIVTQRTLISENEAKFIAYSLASALDYLHSKHICHRDLKLENVLCRYNQWSVINEVKLVDFGMATTFDTQMISTDVGTVGYKAPEQFLPFGYNEKVDLWSLGILTYILLCGFPPFRNKEHNKDLGRLPFWVYFNNSDDFLVGSICTSKLTFPLPFWRSISIEAKYFISKLLEKEPEYRIPASAAMQDCWFSKYNRKRQDMGQTTSLKNNLESLLAAKKSLHVPAISPAEAFKAKLAILQRPDQEFLKERNILKCNFTSSVAPSIQGPQYELYRAQRKDCLKQLLKLSINTKQ